jgi:simple sugar transport system permease protein
MNTLLAASDVFSEEAFTALVAGAILAGAPLLFASLGELVSQRAGVLNIGLEGMMLIGAYAGFVAAYHGGSEWLGFGAGLLAGAGVSLLMVLFCVRWGLDQIVVGIAITLTCEGATALIFNAEFAESRPTLGSVDKVALPGLSELPVVGGKGESNGSIFTQPLVVYIGLALAVLVAWTLRRTHAGLNVRAAGDAPAALDAAGVSVFATRSWAVLFAGAMAGLGGAYLSIVAAGLFQDTVVGGRGFIAIVLAMLARGRPLWAVVGALLFGASLSIADWAQVAQINISTDLVFMLPFVLVLVVLVIFGRRAYLPAALALPYERGSR